MNARKSVFQVCSIILYKRRNRRHQSMKMSRIIMEISILVSEFKHDLYSNSVIIKIYRKSNCQTQDGNVVYSSFQFHGLLEDKTLLEFCTLARSWKVFYMHEPQNKLHHMVMDLIKSLASRTMIEFDLKWVLQQM